VKEAAGKCPSRNTEGRRAGRSVHGHAADLLGYCLQVTASNVILSLHYGHDTATGPHTVTFVYALYDTHGAIATTGLLVVNVDTCLAVFYLQIVRIIGVNLSPTSSGVMNM
jgi:hypothetical protein